MSEEENPGREMIHHLISDIHLDYNSSVKTFSDLIIVYPQLFANNSLKNNMKDIRLLIAGDIGSPLSDNYWSFLYSCTLIYRDVIFTSGNHEYYSLNNKISMEEIEEILVRKSKMIPRLYYLQSNSITLDRIIYYGCTLWTHIPKDKMELLAKRMNNYNYIYSSSLKKITPYELDELHHIQRVKLETFLSSHINGKIVIITHHLPLMNLVDPKYSSELIHSFNSDLSYLLQDNIKLWLSGHIHHALKHSFIFPSKNEAQFIVNPLGNHIEAENKQIVEFKF
jgi:hypothetical protein